MPLTGDWDGFTRAIQNLSRGNLERELEPATRRIGQMLARDAKANIERTRPEWPPLSPVTIRRKRSSKPLFDTGQLVRSINYRVLSPYSVVVGAYKVRRAEGREANVAAIMESGAGPAKRLDYDDLTAIRVEWGSPDQRIPARPYLGPALLEDRDKVINEWARAVARAVRR